MKMFQLSHPIQPEAKTFFLNRHQKEISEPQGIPDRARFPAVQSSLPPRLPQAEASLGSPSETLLFECLLNSPQLSLHPLNARHLAHACLIQLYLPGLNRPVTLARQESFRCANIILSQAPKGFESIVQELKKDGLGNEAYILQNWASQKSIQCADAGLVPSGCENGCTNRASVITRADGYFPAAWNSRRRVLSLPAFFARGNVDHLLLHTSVPFLEDCLGSDCPFASCDSNLTFSQQIVAIVGSTRPTRASANLASQLAKELADQSACVISGGAPGIDLITESTALQNGGSAIEIRPCGLSQPWGISNLDFRLNKSSANDGLESNCQSLLEISCFPDRAPFATAAAMERNALIYSLGAITFAIQPQLKTGGTWHGAVRALRSQLGVVAVTTENSVANFALRNLGAWTFWLEGSTQDRQINDLVATSPCAVVLRFGRIRLMPPSTLFHTI